MVYGAVVNTTIAHQPMLALSTSQIILLGTLICAAALLYSSIGHGGGSGYIAAMALFGLAPEVMKPTALVLNILVASIGTVKFYRAGCFSWPLFWPFAIASIPFAFLGGTLALPVATYKIVVGLVLLFAAYRIFDYTRQAPTAADKPLVIPLAIFFGAGIGLLSGLTGVGGGIFLSPLLLLMGWANMRQTAGVSAPFILVNSIAGLLGHISSVQMLPGALPVWAAAALIGAIIGTEFGSRRLNSLTLRRLLAAVLVIAGLKMIFV